MSSEVAAARTNREQYNSFQARVPAEYSPAADASSDSNAEQPCQYNSFQARRPAGAPPACPKPGTDGAFSGQAPVTKMASTTAVAKTAAPELAAKANELMSALFEERVGLIKGMDPYGHANFYAGTITAEQAETYRTHLDAALASVDAALAAGAESDSLGDTCHFLRMFKFQPGVWFLPHQVKKALFDSDVQTLETKDAMKHVKALHGALDVPLAPYDSRPDLP